jgi:hypothetical protein
MRDEFLNGEIFYSLKEAQILTERRRVLFLIWSSVPRPPYSPSLSLYSEWHLCQTGRSQGSEMGTYSC